MTTTTTRSTAAGHGPTIVVPGQRGSHHPVDGSSTHRFRARTLALTATTAAALAATATALVIGTGPAATPQPAQQGVPTSLGHANGRHGVDAPDDARGRISHLVSPASGTTVTVRTPSRLQQRLAR